MSDNKGKAQSIAMGMIRSYGRIGADEFVEKLQFLTDLLEKSFVAAKQDAWAGDELRQDWGDSVRREIYEAAKASRPGVTK